MKISKFRIDGPLLVTPKVFGDERGYFYESFRSDLLSESFGETINFVQANQSYSKDVGTVRGLHYQAPPHAQAKLVKCVAGGIIDILVDVRRDSETFGENIRVELTAENMQQILVPRGFLHGFATTEPNTIVSYMVDGYYNAESDGSVYWNSESLNLDWGISSLGPVMSDKDRQAVKFSDWQTPF